MRFPGRFDKFPVPDYQDTLGVHPKVCCPRKSRPFFTLVKPATENGQETFELYDEFYDDIDDDIDDGEEATNDDYEEGSADLSYILTV